MDEKLMLILKGVLLTVSFLAHPPVTDEDKETAKEAAENYLAQLVDKEEYFKNPFAFKD